jgi:hypothetical protein
MRVTLCLLSLIRLGLFGRNRQSRFCFHFLRDSAVATENHGFNLPFTALYKGGGGSAEEGRLKRITAFYRG